MNASTREQIEIERANRAKSQFKDTATTMSRKIQVKKIPGVLSREELAAAQLKAKKRREEHRLKVEKDMAEKAPKGLFWRVPEYTESTSTKIEYRVISEDIRGPLREAFLRKNLKTGERIRKATIRGITCTTYDIGEKIEIITTTTWRHNGDERYVVFKTEERERKLKVTKDDLKHFDNGNRHIAIWRYHKDVPDKISEKDQITRAKFQVNRPQMI